MDWNPGLWEPEAFHAVRALLGIALPSPEPEARPGQTITALRELERGFPDAFFRDVMADEVRRALAARTATPGRCCPGSTPGGAPTPATR